MNIEIILNIDSSLKISSFSCVMCLKSKKSPSITIAKKGIFWWGISNFNVVYWIASHLTKFCHYSLKSINSNFREKLTFFWQKFKLVLYVYCATFATIVRQSKGLFYVFPNILSKHNPICTKFCTLVFGNVCEIDTKNRLNMTITFEIIIILNHF